MLTFIALEPPMHYSLANIANEVRVKVLARFQFGVAGAQVRLFRGLGEIKLGRLFDNHGDIRICIFNEGTFYH